MKCLLQDLRYALRQVHRNAGFAAVAVLTLALGMGLNTAMFSIVYGIILRPLPYADPARVVELADSSPQGTEELTVTYPEFQFFRERNSVFESLAVFTPVGFNLSTGHEAERVNGLHVSSNYFHLLGIKPVLGRDFLPEEDSGNGARVALLSYNVWQRQAAGNPDIVGRAITLSGNPYTVIGVMPANFERVVTPVSRGETGVWVPMALVARSIGNGENLAMIGRLKPGLSFDQARAGIALLTDEFRKIPEAHYQVGQAAHLDLQHYQAMLSLGMRTILFLLLGAVGCVLLIASANVVNLLLGRALARGRELAVRSAIGASRARLVSQLVTESVLLSILGAVFGLFLAYWFLQGALAISPQDLPRSQDIRLDGWAFGFTFLVALATGVGFGSVPGWMASKLNPEQTLRKTATRVGGASRVRFRSALTVGQVALSLVLLSGAALLIETFRHVLLTDPGFNPSQVLSIEIWSSGPKDGPHALPESRFYDQVLQRIERLPSVQSAAAVAAGLPLERGGNSGLEIPGKSQPENCCDYRVITPEFFGTLGIPVKLGRAFTAADNEDSAPVAIVNESFARRVFPNGSAIGEHVISNEDRKVREIVGVTRDVKSYLDQPVDATIFLPLAQVPAGQAQAWEDWFPTHILVRTSGEPLVLSHSIEQQVHAIDPAVTVGQIRSMEEVRSASVSVRRFNMALLSLFAGLALVLAAIGIYGVIAYQVTQRTHEIGVRMALGAERQHILRLVLQEGLSLVAVGLVLGFIGELALTRLLKNYLYQVKAMDPLAFVSTAVLLLLVALLACAVPARRAAKVDPMVALRYE
jgi:putative ABC transport system permease protein